MQLHRNAKLALRGRRELVLAIERGISLKAAAAGFSVSPATAHLWWHRWRAANEQERRSLTCLHDRPSRPRRCPRMPQPSRASPTKTTSDPARIPREVAGSLSRRPVIPASQVPKKSCSWQKSPPTPAQPGSAKTGLSRRRSRVRVPSLPLKVLANSRTKLADEETVLVSRQQTNTFGVLLPLG
jgi:hypothetical protein